MKKVLFITYIFPPTAGAGVQRSLKFVKYLPSFNYQSFVITPKKAAEDAQDESLLKEIPPQTKVYRTFSFEPRSWPFLRKVWRKKIEKIDALIDQESFDNLARQSLLKRMVDFLRILFFIPDDSIGWLPFILWRGLKTIKKDKIDLIFASAPPYTVLISGILLKKLTKKPLVVDFRDPWTNWPANLRYYRYPPWRYRLDEKLERWVLRSADMIINVSPAEIGYFKNKYKIPAEKLVFLPNGFDQEDFKNFKKRLSKKFIFTYTGSFYGARNPTAFLEAYKEFIKQEKLSSKVYFVGEYKRGIYEIISKLKLQNYVIITKYLSHKESINYLEKSTALLLINAPGPQNKGIISGKLFEYMASGKPILALTPKDGVAAELIRKTKTGLVVDPENVFEIEKAIEFLYQKWQKGEKIINPAWDEIKKYERKKLTQRLAKVFNEILEQ